MASNAATCLVDNALAGEIRHHVEAGNWVQGALREVVTKHVAAFGV